MADLANVVFERTPEGTAEISTSASSLSRALRSVLLAVDGRSSVSRYAPFLTALTPLDDKFAALEQLGLLRRKGGRPADLVDLTGAAASSPALAQAAAALLPTGPPAPAVPAAPSFEPELQALSRLIGVIPDNPPRTAGASAARDIWDDMATFAPESSAAEPQPAAAPTLTPAPAPQLADLLAEMEAFLSASVGLDGLPVAIMVAQITSFDQLRSELAAYSELMRSYGLGAPTEAHLSSLQAQLARCS